MSCSRVAALKREISSLKTKLDFLTAENEGEKKEVEKADQKLTNLEAKHKGVRQDLKSENDGLLRERDVLLEDLSAAKKTLTQATTNFATLRRKVIDVDADVKGSTTHLTILKQEIVASHAKEQRTQADKRATNDQLQSMKQDVLTQMARIACLERQGFVVDEASAGTIVKTHYKLHLYSVYKMKKAKV